MKVLLRPTICERLLRRDFIHDTLCCLLYVARMNLCTVFSISVYLPPASQICIELFVLTNLQVDPVLEFAHSSSRFCMCETTRTHLEKNLTNKTFLSPHALARVPPFPQIRQKLLTRDFLQFFPPDFTSKEEMGMWAKCDGE